ncbi:Tat pathway signal protein [Catenulispora yoronensis]
MHPSVTIRGVAMNDWADRPDTSEPLALDGPLNAPAKLISESRPYSGGDQRSTASVFTGWDAAALALHAANLAAASGARRFNFIGHSRGAVECVMAAWFLYAYGMPDIDVRILAIDPVPGPGNWYGILTQLPPNVAEYVGITAWDHLDIGFDGLVPRPNGRMTGNHQRPVLGDGWQHLADNYQLKDPLKPDAAAAQPTGYRLFASRGRHGTVAGIATSDGKYDYSKVSDSAARVPHLIYRLARAYLTSWGSEFTTRSAVTPSVLQLRQEINLDHAQFDAMGGGALRDSVRPGRPYVREISSISGRLPWNTYYLEDVVGDPPYRQPYPVTAARAGKGWAHWTFL